MPFDPTLTAIVGVAFVAMLLLVLRLKGSAPRRSSMRPPTNMANVSLPSHVRADIDKLLLEGKLIDAIKAVREETGLGLKEAKDFVESLRR